MNHDVVDALRQRLPAQAAKPRYTRGPRPGFDPASLTRPVRAPVAEKPVAETEPHWITELYKQKGRARGRDYAIELIYRSVTRETGVSREQLDAPDKTKRLVIARRQLCYALAAHTSLSYEAIAALVGGLNHTTIWYAVRVHCRHNQLEYPRLPNGGQS